MCGYMLVHVEARGITSPLELELQAVVSHSVWGLGVKLGYSARALSS